MTENAPYGAGTPYSFSVVAGAGLEPATFAF